jgi:hypothetical protein
LFTADPITAPVTQQATAVGHQAERLDVRQLPGFDIARQLGGYAL